MVEMPSQADIHCPAEKIFDLITDVHLELGHDSSFSPLLPGGTGFSRRDRRQDLSPTPPLPA